MNSFNLWLRWRDYMKKKGLLVVAMAMALFSTTMAIPASADTTTKNGLSVSYSTDKEDYKSSEDIHATVEVKNKSKRPATDLVIKAEAPNGYEVDPDSSNQNVIDELPKGETIVFETIFVPKSSTNLPTTTKKNDNNNVKDNNTGTITNNSDNTSSDTSKETKSDDTNPPSSESAQVDNNVPSGGSSDQSSNSGKKAEDISNNDENVDTGAEESTLPYLLALLGIIGVIVSLKHGKGKQVVSLLMVGALTLSFLPELDLDASADNSNTISVISTVKIDNKSVELKATLNYLSDIVTIEFETNGGSTINSQGVVKGDCVIKPANPLKKGFVFDGWYTDKALSNAFDFGTPITEGITLYAKWSPVQVDIQIDTHPEKYEDTRVDRTFDVTVSSSNAVITEISYKLNGPIKEESGIIGTKSGTYPVNVLLEGGENTFTVFVTTEDNNILSRQVKVKYDSGEDFTSGWDFEDYEKNGVILVPVFKYDTDEPSFYVMSNVIDVFFRSSSTKKERDEFILSRSDIFEEKLGELNATDNAQIKLKVPLTKKKSLTFEEYSNEVYEKIIQFDDLSTIIKHAYPIKVYKNTFFETVSSDTWDLDKDASNDWWIKKINAVDAWKYDNRYNSDFLKNITIGIMDNGFHIRHPDFEGRHIELARDNNSPKIYNSIYDIADHGTNVLGIMAAVSDNNEGIAGVLHNNCSFVVDDISDGPFNDIRIGLSLNRLVEADAKVINISLGESTTIVEDSYPYSSNHSKQRNKCSESMGNLLEKGFDFIVVQSAGNGNKKRHGVNYWDNGLYCDINIDNCYETDPDDIDVKRSITKRDIIDRIIIAANLQEDGSLHSSSNGVTYDDFGDLNIIAAPGTHIYTTNNNNEYLAVDGTSFAAPIVSSVCSLVWSVNPSFKGNTVVDIVMSNTEGFANSYMNPPTHPPIDEKYYIIQTPSEDIKTHTIELIPFSHTKGGMGIVNAKKAVEAAIDLLPTYKTKIVDAMTGKGIEATAVIKNGNGDPVGSSDGTIKSNADGSLTLPKLPFGTYLLTVTAENYLKNECYCQIGTQIAYDSNGKAVSFIRTIPDIPLSPIIDDDYYRIILRWGEQPRDLDAHLTATIDTGEVLHTYYHNRNPFPYYTSLDYDYTNSYGPETITITNFDKLDNVTFAVHDYSNSSKKPCDALSNSGATVLVYKGSERLAVFSVPVGIGGTEWDVFSFDAFGEILNINEMKYCGYSNNVLA